MVGASGLPLNSGLHPLLQHTHQQAQPSSPDAELSQEEDDELQVLGPDMLTSAIRERNPRKRRRRRADVAQWTDPAVKILIGVLRLLRHNPMYEDDVDRTGSSPFKPAGGSNKQIWKSVAKALQLKCHKFDAGQCKTKFKGLKAEYHSTVEALGITGGSHAVVPENWEELPGLSDEQREKARKFKFFADMRGYFSGAPVLDAESLFDGEKPDEFLRNLHRREDSDKEDSYLDKTLTLTIDSEATGRRGEGKLLKRKPSGRLPTLILTKIPPPPPPQPTVWPMPGSADDGISGAEPNLPQDHYNLDESMKRDLCSKRMESLLEKETRLKEEYRAKKLHIEERRLLLAEKNVQVEALKAANEKQRLENQARKLELEERRLKHQEDQLSSSSTMLNLLATLMSKNIPVSPSMQP